MMVLKWGLEVLQLKDHDRTMEAVQEQDLWIQLIAIGDVRLGLMMQVVLTLCGIMVRAGISHLQV
jgi:hypothetical protein